MTAAGEARQPRDRDQRGRPRNARPRDELGRPLPRPDAAAGEHRLGPGGAAGAQGPGSAAAAGGALLLAGRPFHAHEVFEDAWHASAGPDRDLWRGLAQVAVGLTHARRGNARGAAALLARGAQRLRDYVAVAGPAAHGVQVSSVAARAQQLAGQVERDGLSSLTPEDLLLSLTTTLAQ